MHQTNQKIDIMTNFQKIKAAYISGSKSMAYLAFKADPTSNALEFTAFCAGMDRVISLNNSKPTKLN